MKNLDKLSIADLRALSEILSERTGGWIRFKAKDLEEEERVREWMEDVNHEIDMAINRKLANLDIDFSIFSEESTIDFSALSDFNDQIRYIYISSFSNFGQIRIE